MPEEPGSPSGVTDQIEAMGMDREDLLKLVRGRTVLQAVHVSETGVQAVVDREGEEGKQPNWAMVTSSRPGDIERLITEEDAPITDLHVVTSDERGDLVVGPLLSGENEPDTSLAGFLMGYPQDGDFTHVVKVSGMLPFEPEKAEEVMSEWGITEFEWGDPSILNRGSSGR